MKTKTISIFEFSELSDSAKERARAWWREGIDFAWNEESLNSVESFCKEFNVTVTGYSINPYEQPSIDTDAENSNFRGRKLKEFNSDAMPTGYILDCALYMTFFDSFKKSGDAKQAFEDAIWNAAIEWRDDLESQLSDEYIDDVITANEYEFDEDGEIA